MTNPSRDGFWSHHSGSTAHKRQVRSNRGPRGAVKIAGSRGKGLLPSIPAVMTWYADWEARKEALLKVGLPVLVRGVELRNGFLSITLDADEACLLRTHAARGSTYTYRWATFKNMTAESMLWKPPCVYTIVGPDNSCSAT